MEKIINAENFEQEVLNAELPVLVDFYADWCGPCKMMAPAVESLAKELMGKCEVGKCNIDDNMTLAQKYRVLSVPSFMVFKGGEAIAVFVGAMSAAELRRRVEEAI